MSVIWTSDLCGCKSTYSIVDDIATGEIIESCNPSFHATFDEILEDNRKKNTNVNAITEAVDMTNKEISFTFENGIITLTLHNFTVEDMDIINLLDLNVDVIQG